MKLIATILAALALTGCATAEYQAYADIHKAKAQAEAARYKALADIAAQGDTAAKVAAVMSLNQGTGQGQMSVAAPKTAGDHLLQWTAALLPSLTNIYGIQKQAQVGITQSNNARELGVSTNSTFLGMAGKIQAPGAVTTTTTTLSGTGSMGSGAYNYTPSTSTSTSTSSSLTCTTGPC